ncbi:ribA/ribD-fused uncharacterized protein [Parasphingopyxis lamellibrachiae]|uniref:RibA/ribD-fused uncharacterized protein n=2 Tax=Parasphingopyxis lamellibrachiae TaxID=680125 RepID=A0A3D9FGX1_9SPHN|nr:ribA/ribD-fused uncharacterized protein [Parasphingopyxis lamellibrachiae]
MIPKKFSLPKTELHDSSQHLQFHQIASELRNRIAELRKRGPRRLSYSQTRLLKPQIFSTDGSIVLSHDVFDRFAPAYFKRSRRAVFFEKTVHLRGGRYLISANPTFEIRTKLKTYREDLEEGLNALDETRHPLFQLAIADYIKNAAVTMLNSFLQDEKVGQYKHTIISYQSARRNAIYYTQAAVNLYYGILIQDELRVKFSFQDLIKNQKPFDKMQSVILDRYREGVFSSRHITRPEATHPIVIAAAVAQFANAGSREIDLIIGMPSGSTELCFAHAFGQQIFNSNSCDIKLFPVSFHSSKNEFDRKEDMKSAFNRWIIHNSRDIREKNVLIVDDNSSTGNTIDKIRDIVDQCSPKEIHISIAEADIIRSEIDLLSSSRPNIAHKSLYDHAVNILPVSRVLKPKTDLKEILERRKMELCTKRRYLSETKNFPRTIIGNVYLDLIRESTEDVLDRLPEDGIIRKFQKTPLSNFAPVNVSYQGERFNSVEHGYQAMKFPSSTWEKVSDRHIEAINRKLSPGGERIGRKELPHLFSSQQLSAGGSKKVAKYLRQVVHVRDDWDEVKVYIMIALLIQKFSKEKFYRLLKSTGDKYLIEGNTWDDTFWGECNGRGRNFLGRSLMKIRECSIETLQVEATKIEETLI